MDASDNRNNHTTKRKRDNYDGDDTSAVANGGVDFSLLEEIEKSHNSIEALDLKTLKKLVLSFERRLKDNIAARLKYPDQPEKFADSEVELHEEIEKLKILAGAPELYPDLVNLNVIPSILDLLVHDNTDIAIDVVGSLHYLTDLVNLNVVPLILDLLVHDNNDIFIDVVGLLQDLTDEDVLDENDEFGSLVQNLLRLSESDADEVAAVYSTLSTIENLIEVKPAVAEMVCERTKLMRWIVGKIKVREFDSNKQYASEILAILLQSSAANQKRLGQMNGVDVVLQAVAMYKSRDPRSLDERRWVELMIIIMNQKKLCYGSAIRALDFAMTNYPAACERFVDVMGLKTAFPAFMGKMVDEENRRILEVLDCFDCIPTSKNRRDLRGTGGAPYIISCITFWWSFEGSRRERLLSKFCGE
uniref:Putative armadillo-type fold protein n=1 Tax=Helianthus annuus TaxID=4232 RepID=A0A251S5H8_HELAN